MEKQKLVYILNRDAQAHLTISSPLEAHKSNTLLYHVVGVDVGFENPVFACLEIDYEEADGDATGEAAQKTQQTLTFYELDLGLNHVVRKYRYVFLFFCSPHWRQVNRRLLLLVSRLRSTPIFSSRFPVAVMDRPASWYAQRITSLTRTLATKMTSGAPSRDAG